MKWLELHIDTARAGLEPVSELLREQGVEGLVIDDEADFKDFLENNHQYWDYVDDELLAEKHGKCRVTFYLEESKSGFSTLAQVRIALSALKKQHPEYAPLLLTMENVEDADWENNWKQFYKPMEIGERLLVIPEWEQAKPTERVKLILNPGLTFGTGSHATTRLCLQALEKHIRGGEKVLDLGCGSGILSIAALLLGARDALPATSTTSAWASPTRMPRSTASGGSTTPSARATCSATKGSRASSAETMISSWRTSWRTSSSRSRRRCGRC